jgi:hypothetical protein
MPRPWFSVALYQQSDGDNTEDRLWVAKAEATGDILHKTSKHKTKRYLGSWGIAYNWC